MQAMVIVTSGTNCDLELAQAFEDAGASCQTVQLHSILDAPETLDGAELVGLPGGFAYGDAVAAGRIKAALMRERVVPVLSRLLDRGVPMIAPCNGFQTAVQCGLLPGPAPSRPEVALAPNISGRFEDR
ncbi:MAG: phosphoribosylformylglycinamidine synthase subunit PurQ, partial [Planctomycetota bacterium]|nr:phosphoribosylformylglycinamidine synthase subunit PurQ [Planctomycetota bacterium]